MRYWDLGAREACPEETDSAALRRLADVAILTWSVSAVELASAIERRARDGSLTEADARFARTALDQLMAAWTEVANLGAVRERALRLVATHPLRAADAMQLASALLAVADRPAGHEFVCADRRLGDAARREGFRVLPDA